MIWLTDTPKCAACGQPTVIQSGRFVCLNCRYPQFVAVSW